MSNLLRIFDSVKQTIQDTRGNINVPKDTLYSHYLNKLTNTQIDNEYFLNSHDYDILANKVNNIENKNTKLFIEEYLNLYYDVTSKLDDVPISNILYFYQNHYNRLKTLKQIKTYHLEVPEHIRLLEEELFRTVYDMKNIMFYLFGSLRQVLKTGCEVFVLESFSNPQTGFRKLESIQELPIIDKDGYEVYIQSQIETLNEQYQELSSMLDLLKEQVNVLLLYYQQFDTDFISRCVNEVGNPYATNMYAPKSDYNERASELKELRNILNEDKR